jgi:hypothetical protein
MVPVVGRVRRLPYHVHPRTGMPRRQTTWARVRNPRLTFGRLGPLTITVACRMVAQLNRLRDEESHPTKLTATMIYNASETTSYGYCVRSE